MRRLKKTAPDGGDTHTDTPTWGLYYWIGPVGPIQWQFYRKVFKLQHYSSVTLHVSTKNPISEVKKKIPSKINPNCASTFFSYTFFKVFHENSAQTDVSKVMWVSILKGLKHLNTVLNWSLRLRFTGYYIIICTYIRCWEHRPCFNEKYIHKLQS